VKSLVASGADLSAGDYDHRTPLHLAAAEGHIIIVRYLIAKVLCSSAHLTVNHTR
jgi:glutaminase